MARETWTDERLDDLKGEMNERFDQVDKRFDRMDADIREIRGDIKDMQRLMIQGFIGICTLMVTGFAFIGFQ